jgi:hypothetical protein
MKQLVTSRAAVLMTGAIFAVITACSDSNSSPISGPKASANNDPRPSGDTAKKGGPGDTTGSRNPGTNPVAKFTLTLHVGSYRTGSDSETTDPIANATVTIYEQKTTITHTGPDTLQIDTTLIATGSTDANGDVTFQGLKGASEYLIKITPPPGSLFDPTSFPLHFVTVETIKLDVALRRHSP